MTKAADAKKGLKEPEIPDQKENKPEDSAAQDKAAEAKATTAAQTTPKMSELDKEAEKAKKEYIKSQALDKATK